MEGAMYIEQTPDSGYIVNVNDVSNATTCLYRLNFIGDTLWTKIYSAGSGSTHAAFPNSMATVFNSVYGLTGYYSNGGWPSTFFIACLTNGSLLASKVYNTATFGNDSRAINKTSDGGFIMTGEISTSSSSSDIYLIRTNTFGDTLWTMQYNKSYAEVGEATIQTADTGFIVAGIIFDTAVFKYNIYLLKTDLSGDPVWANQYYSIYEQVPSSIQQTIDGGYIISGSAMDSTFARNVYLIKTDTLGDTLWTRRFNAGSSINCTGYFVRQTKDGGYIISGISQTPPVGTYIIKTDSMGMVSSSTGIAEINNPFLFDVFPNPSSGVFTVEVKGIPKSNSSLTVYDVTGQCLHLSKLKNYSKLQINLSNLASGLYVARLQSGENSVCKKIIIQK
jgi:hypothetical protein